MKPLVMFQFVLQVSDFAFSVGDQFLGLFGIKGKRVFLYALVSALDEERAFYCGLGIAQADAQSARGKTVGVVSFPDDVKKGFLGVRCAQVRGGRGDPLAQ